MENKIENKDSQQVALSEQEAQAWKQEAQALGRSPSHLNKIDQTINEAPKTTLKNKPGISIDRRDALAMKKDRSDYQNLKLDNRQNQNQTARVEKTKGLKR